MMFSCVSFSVIWTLILDVEIIVVVRKSHCLSHCNTPPSYKNQSIDLLHNLPESVIADKTMLILNEMTYSLRLTCKSATSFLFFSPKYFK